jgi:hypothetical protein
MEVLKIGEYLIMLLYHVWGESARYNVVIKTVRM